MEKCRQVTCKRLPTSNAAWWLALKVTVEYLGSIAGLVDSGQLWEIEIEETAVLGDLLKNLVKRYGEVFKNAVFQTTDTGLKPKCVITINGRLIREMGGIESKLESGDNIVLMQIVGGG